MRGIGSFVGCGMALLLAGCGVFSSAEAETEERKALVGYAPLPTEDRLRTSEATPDAETLPLAPIPRGSARQLDELTLERLRRYDREAWLKYNRTLRDADIDDAARDRACRDALEALVLALVKRSGSPVDAKCVSRGLELVELSRTREHKFAAPTDRIREQARRRRNTPEGKVVMLYLGRYDLYHKFLLGSLKGCGLDRSAVYWTVSFTMLDLELRGIEEKYLKIIGSPEWK